MALVRMVALLRVLHHGEVPDVLCPSGATVDWVGRLRPHVHDELRNRAV